MFRQYRNITTKCRKTQVFYYTDTYFKYADNPENEHSQLLTDVSIQGMCLCAVNQLQLNCFITLQSQKGKLTPSPVDFTITPETLQNVKEVSCLDFIYLLVIYYLHDSEREQEKNE